MEKGTETARRIHTMNCPECGKFFDLGDDVIIVLNGTFAQVIHNREEMTEVDIYHRSCYVKRDEG